MRRRTLVCLAVAGLACALAAAPAHASCKGRDGATTSGPPPKILPVARGSIKVDGILDDATWASACFVDDFEQKQPKFRAPPTHRVITAVAIDDTTLYVAARMWAESRDTVDTALTQRDHTGQAERFIVSLDPSNTRRLAYSFAITAAGVRADWIHTDDSEGSRNYAWNPVWTAATAILPDGWSAEMAIPLSQLRLPNAPATSWGINFNWYVPHLNEDVFWRAVPPDRRAWASLFGALTELPPVHPRLAIEILPYISTQMTVAESIADPLAKRLTPGFDAGVDVKVTPRPGLTVVGTVNPDFGQVDADPEFVNLTQYEVLLPELRPFFVENAPLFSDAGGSYFYSRRIGGLPLTQPTTYDVATDGRVRILGATTVGGYVAPDTQVAVLGAVTNDALAPAIVTEGTAPTTLVVSPLTGWVAARIEHTEGASIFGATATAVERALGGTGLSSLLDRTALVAGADARMRTDDRTWELYMYGGASEVAGDAAAITTIEESAAHLFQRPDTTHVHLDTDATSLAGWHGGAQLNKRAGVWHGTLAFDTDSPGLELNDLGTLHEADYLAASAAVLRLDTVPGEHLLAWDVYSAATAAWDWGGLQKPTSLHTDVNATSLAFNNVDLAVDATTPGDSNDLTRGGPRMHVGWAEATSLYASTPYGRTNQLSGRVEVDASETLQQGVIASGTLTTRLTPALRLDLSPTLTMVQSERQYVATVTGVGGGDDTYGSRYIFGHLHRHEASMQLRGTWSLSPDLVFTLYAQPFASVGHYTELGELTAAGAGDIRWYDTTAHTGAYRTIVDGGSAFEIDEPNYTVLSLRSTAVLRWEFLPGSTLYVVWQQQRAGSTTVEEPLHGVLPDVVTQPGVHTLAVKLSYWFG